MCRQQVLSVKPDQRIEESWIWLRQKRHLSGQHVESFWFVILRIFIWIGKSSVTNSRVNHDASCFNEEFVPAANA